MSERVCTVAVCKCGGFVFAGVMGYALDTDAETLTEASKLEKRGFEIRRDVAVQAVREMEMCHRVPGRCTDVKKKRGQKKALAVQTEAGLT